jgi:hypothetical protein
VYFDRYVLPVGNNVLSLPSSNMQTEAVLYFQISLSTEILKVTFRKTATKYFLIILCLCLL